jgi:tetratricopeptide (TPR) repeat protein
VGQTFRRHRKLITEQHYYGNVRLGLVLAVLASSAINESAAGLNQSDKLTDQHSALYQKGMDLLRARRYTDALEQFRLLEQETPGSPQGPSGEGIALALMGQPDDAVRALKKALQIDPNFWVARRELGIVYWSQGLKEQAAAELTPVIRLHPEDAPVNVMLGQYSFERKDYSQALACLAHVPGQVAADPQLSLIQAEAQLKTEQASAAAETLSSLVGRRGLTDEQKFELAWLLGQARHFKKAIEVFNELSPGFPDFRRNYGLALAYFGDGQYEKCTAALKELLARGSSRPELFSLLGVAEEKTGHTKEAYDAFRQGILNNPKDVQNYLNIATLSCEHLNYDLAVQILTSGIERVPDSHELFLSRGIWRGGTTIAPSGWLPTIPGRIPLSAYPSSRPATWMEPSPRWNKRRAARPRILIRIIFWRKL